MMLTNAHTNAPLAYTTAYATTATNAHTNAANGQRTRPSIPPIAFAPVRARILAAHRHGSACAALASVRFHRPCCPRRG